MHVLVEEATAYAGLSRFVDSADPEPWILPERETILVLEGAARIEIAGGPTLDLRVGDLASLPEGRRGGVPGTADAKDSGSSDARTRWISDLSGEPAP